MTFKVNSVLDNTHSVAAYFAHFLVQSKVMTDQNNKSNKCWENGSIFKSVKIILEVSLTPLSGPPVIDISFAQDTFWSGFGFPEHALPMSLEVLISESNVENDVANLTQAILSGSSYNTFITLRDANGVDLACNVQVMTARKSDNRASPSSTDLGGISRDHFTTMTIRSASIIGNTRAINVLVDSAMVDSSLPTYRDDTHSKMASVVTERMDQNTLVFQSQGTAKKAKVSAAEVGVVHPGTAASLPVV